MKRTNRTLQFLATILISSTALEASEGLFLPDDLIPKLSGLHDLPQRPGLHYLDILMNVKDIDLKAWSEGFNYCCGPGLDDTRCYADYVHLAMKLYNQKAQKMPREHDFNDFFLLGKTVYEAVESEKISQDSIQDHITPEGLKDILTYYRSILRTEDYSSVLSEGKSALEKENMCAQQQHMFWRALISHPQAEPSIPDRQYLCRPEKAPGKKVGTDEKSLPQELRAILPKDYVRLISSYHQLMSHPSHRKNGRMLYFFLCLFHDYIICEAHGRERTESEKNGAVAKACFAPFMRTWTEYFKVKGPQPQTKDWISFLTISAALFCDSCTQSIDGATIKRAWQEAQTSSLIEGRTLLGLAIIFAQKGYEKEAEECFQKLRLTLSTTESRYKIGVVLYDTLANQANGSAKVALLQKFVQYIEEHDELFKKSPLSWCHEAVIKAYHYLLCHEQNYALQMRYKNNIMWLQARLQGKVLFLLDGDQLHCLPIMETSSAGVSLVELEVQTSVPESLVKIQKKKTKKKKKSSSSISSQLMLNEQKASNVLLGSEAGDFEACKQDLLAEIEDCAKPVEQDDASMQAQNQPDISLIEQASKESPSRAQKSSLDAQELKLSVEDQKLVEPPFPVVHFEKADSKESTKNKKQAAKTQRDREEVKLQNSQHKTDAHPQSVLPGLSPTIRQLITDYKNVDPVIEKKFDAILASLETDKKEWKIKRHLSFLEKTFHVNFSYHEAHGSHGGIWTSEMRNRLRVFVENVKTEIFPSGGL